MPAFSFEKLPPPVRRDPAPAAPVDVASVKPYRGIIVQMLDRLTEARLRRTGADVTKDRLQSGMTRD